MFQMPRSPESAWAGPPVAVGRRPTPGLSRACTVVLVGLAMSACTCLPKGQAELDVGARQLGLASWYGEPFHGWQTASGEIYDMEAMTSAHRTLPLGTRIRVTNLDNGRFVLVRVNDRGPYAKGRILDLSYGAAKKLEMVGTGVAAVHVEVVGHEPASWRDTPDPLERLARALAGLDEAPREPMPPEPPPFRTVATDVLPKRAVTFPRGEMVLERRARRVAAIFEADAGVSIVSMLVLT
ncbi:MAG: septal ring lytic transglycosylase RlpA family protein [Nitrospirales bacterium]